MTENSKNTSQKKRNTANGVDVKRLKKAWERLMHRQKHFSFRKARVYSVDIVDDGKGGKTLQVQMSDGKVFNDDGDKRNLLHGIHRRRKHSFSRLMSLVSLARVTGANTVASNLPPRVRRAFIRIYKRRVGKIEPKQQLLAEEKKNETLNQELQKRQSFKENMLIQNLIKRKQGTR